MTDFDPDDWTALVYPPPGLTIKPGHEARPMPPHVREEACKYIAVICARHPGVARLIFAVPLWLRFCDAWNDTGSRRISMRVI